jgi:hypothetical protein
MFHEFPMPVFTANSQFGPQVCVTAKQSFAVVLERTGTRLDLSIHYFWVRASLAYGYWNWVFVVWRHEFQQLAQCCLEFLVWIVAWSQVDIKFQPPDCSTNHHVAIGSVLKDVTDIRGVPRASAPMSDNACWPESLVMDKERKLALDRFAERVIVHSACLSCRDGGLVYRATEAK